MTRTTRKQREAIAKVYMRSVGPAPIKDKELHRKWLKGYRAFRATATPEFGYGAVMLPWAGMVLGIEKDGYTHS